MAVTHSTAARNAATDAVTALIGASGNLKFRLSGTVGAPGTAVAILKNLQSRVKNAKRFMRLIRQPAIRQLILCWMIAIL